MSNNNYLVFDLLTYKLAPSRYLPRPIIHTSSLSSKGWFPGTCRKCYIVLLDQGGRIVVNGGFLLVKRVLGTGKAFQAQHGPPPPIKKEKEDCLLSAVPRNPTSRDATPRTGFRGTIIGLRLSHGVYLWVFWGTKDRHNTRPPHSLRQVPQRTCGQAEHAPVVPKPHRAVAPPQHHLPVTNCLLSHGLVNTGPIDTKPWS